MTPISGAPRTTMSWMAAAACSSVCRRTIASWWGKRVWSITSTAAPSAVGTMVRRTVRGRSGRTPRAFAISVVHCPPCTGRGPSLRLHRGSRAVGGVIGRVPVCGPPGHAGRTAQGGLQAAPAPPKPVAPADPRTVVLGALKTELVRSKERLRMPKEDPPYFLRYLVRDYDETDMGARFGAIVEDDHTRARQASVEARVGDYHVRQHRRRLDRQDVRHRRLRSLRAAGDRRRWTTTSTPCGPRCGCRPT